MRDTLLDANPAIGILLLPQAEQVKALFPPDHRRRHPARHSNHYDGPHRLRVTTYRIDGEYEDGRHPKQVEFTSDLLEDLRRRDFTINAMAYSHATGLWMPLTVWQI